MSYAALEVFLARIPLCSQFHVAHIMSYSCPSLRYIHHLWFAQGRVECLCPAGTSLTSHGLRLVLAKLRGLIPGYWSAGTAPGALDPPPGARREAGGTEEGQTKTQPGNLTANSPPTVSQHQGHSTQPLYSCSDHGKYRAARTDTGASG